MNFEDRYSRQLLFPGIGKEGQKRLALAKVAVVGCGATGTCVSALLARAGVGRLLIIDRDYVEPSNLQRQSLFDEADAAESLPKAIAAARKIAAFNSEVQVQAEAADLTPENIHARLGDSDLDLILDATDNFETRYLINDFAVKYSKPWIYAAAVAAYAVTMNVIPGETACLSCIFPAPPQGAVETCDTAARPGCPTCDKHEFIHLAGQGRPQITLCGRNSVQIHERHRPVDFAELTGRLQPHGRVKHNDFVLKFWREPYELTLFPDGRAIIKGTTDTAVARSLYARFVGN